MPQAGESPAGGTACTCPSHSTEHTGAPSVHVCGVLGLGLAYCRLHANVRKHHVGESTHLRSDANGPMYPFPVTAGLGAGEGRTSAPGIQHRVWHTAGTQMLERLNSLSRHASKTVTLWAITST